MTRAVLIGGFPCGDCYNSWMGLVGDLKTTEISFSFFFFVPPPPFFFFFFFGGGVTFTRNLCEDAHKVSIKTSVNTDSLT